MTVPPSVRINVVPMFPAQVLGAGGTVVSISNGIYTIGDNYGSLAVGSIPDPTKALFKTQNSVTGVFTAVPAAALLAAGGVGPGGSNGQVQINNGAGGFGGISNTQLTAQINLFSSSLSGAVPQSLGGTTNFLRADGTWAAPPGGGGGTAFGTTVVTSGASYSPTSTDDCIIVQKTVGSATTINLPASTTRNRPFYFKDGKGDAATNNITITPTGEQIDRMATVVMNNNFGAVIITPNPAGGWCILSYG